MAFIDTRLSRPSSCPGFISGGRPTKAPRRGPRHGMRSSKTPQMSPSAASDRHEGLVRVILSDYKQRVKDFWQGRAEVYDDNNTFHPPLCTHLVSVADLHKGSNVLDVATGTGHVAFAAADVVGRTGHVLGIDITESMLQQAKARAASTGKSNVEFQLGDVETITLPDKTLDFILCSNGMAYLQDIPAALKRFHGWLKPGGKLCFNNPLAPMMPLTETLITMCIEKFGVAPEDAAMVLGSEDNIRAALTSAGFRHIQVMGTEEVKVSPNTTPAQFAENMFRMMERFPAAPLSQLLTHQQIEELRADYMAVAVPQAEALPEQDGGIVNQYVMLWAVATA